MRSSWQARFLLPTTQVLAEAGWLAVVYAALQAIPGWPPSVGPLELALLVWAGLAWGRRSRWLGSVASAMGLPALALAGGALGWALDPEVRGLVLDGHLEQAIGIHLAGWIGAVAVWRGASHRSVEDDDSQAEQLLRWGVPGLAVPWLVGHVVSNGAAEVAFTAAAFIGTIVFTSSALSAMGLARLEVVRITTGSDWRANRAWLTLVGGVAIATTAVGIPVAALLGVPARALLETLIGPLQVAFAIIFLLMAPLVAILAAVAEQVRPFLPKEVIFPTFDLSGLRVDPEQVVSDVPTIAFFAIVGLLVVLELLVLLAIFYLRRKEQRRFRFGVANPFEERAIVVPPAALRPPEPHPSRPRVPADATDPTAAYLMALDALQRDGRWPRRPSESPAAHSERARRDGLGSAALTRLAAAYQLRRYARTELTPRERQRAPGRLASLHDRLGREV